MSVSGLGRIALADKMSVDQLREALQNKSLPAYIAVPLIEEKMDMEARMMQGLAMAQAQQYKVPIGDEILQRAVAQRGIDALPTNLVPVEGKAGGGIVAFEDGGEVIHASNGIPPERFEAASEAVRRARREQLGLDQEGLDDQTQRDRDAIMQTLRRMKAAGMDIATLPGRGLMGAFEFGVTRPLRALGVNVPYLPASAYGGDATSMTPYYDALRREDEAKKVAQPVKPDATIPATATAAPPAPAAPAADQGLGGGAPARAIPAPPTTSALAATKSMLEGRPGEGDTGIAGYFQRSEEREKRLMESLGKDRLQGKAFGEYEANLRKEAEQSGLDREQAKYMSLLKAGLAMMAGTSQHALENIGKGAMVGAADYQEAFKDLRKAERERTKEFALIEQARRAEDRDDLKRRDELLMRASDAAQKRDDFGTNALMQAGVEDRRTAMDIWKTQYGGEKTLEAARISASARQRPGITPYQLSQLRGQAMDRITPDIVRAQLVKQLNLKKAPVPGADKDFDARVNEAYENAIDAYVRQRLGMSSGTGDLSQKFSLVPPGAQD